MVMQILQNSHVNNWSWHMSAKCHVNLQNAHECYRMVIRIFFHNGHVDLLHNGLEIFCRIVV
jgi:hypothetical protein